MIDFQCCKFFQFLVVLGGGLLLVGCGGGGQVLLDIVVFGVEVVVVFKLFLFLKFFVLLLFLFVFVFVFVFILVFVGVVMFSFFMGVMQFSLMVFKIQVKVFFCFGYVFCCGDIFVGSGVGFSLSDLQVILCIIWLDGFLKFVQLVGLVDVIVNMVLIVCLQCIDVFKVVVVLLGLVELKKIGFIVEIVVGSFGLVSFGFVDWDVFYIIWVSGVQMLFWVFCKLVGSDVYLVVWLEVCLFFNGVVEVLFWIENGYFMVVGLMNKLVIFSFKLGGVECCLVVIDLLYYCCVLFINGMVLFYWFGDEFGVMLCYDFVYFQVIEVVLIYSVCVVIMVIVVQKLVLSYVLLDKVNFEYDGDYMLVIGY